MAFANKKLAICGSFVIRAINETSTHEGAHFCRKYRSNYKKLHQTRRPQFNIGKLRAGSEKALLSLRVSLARPAGVCLCHWRVRFKGRNDRTQTAHRQTERDGCGMHKLCSQ